MRKEIKNMTFLTYHSAHLGFFKTVNKFILMSTSLGTNDAVVTGAHCTILSYIFICFFIKAYVVATRQVEAIQMSTNNITLL